MNGMNYVLGTLVLFSLFAGLYLMISKYIGYKEAAIAMGIAFAAVGLALLAGWLFRLGKM